MAWPWDPVPPDARPRAPARILAIGAGPAIRTAFRSLLIASSTITADPACQPVSSREERTPFHGGPPGNPQGVEDRGGEVDQAGAALPERPVHEQDAGDERGIDDVIAAPLLGVVLELALGDPAQRRAPRGPIARGEVDEQVGGLADEGAGVDAPRGAGRGGRRPSPRPGRPGRSAARRWPPSSASASSGLTVPCASRPSRFR